MDDTKALEVVSALANGVTPQTTESLGADFAYQSHDVIRALYKAMRALEIVSRRKERTKGTRPVNAGNLWSEEEDRKLLEEFDAGSAIPEIMALHGRSHASIQARLERHGRVQVQGLRLRGRSGSAGDASEEGSKT